MALFKKFVIESNGQSVNCWDLTSIVYDAKSDTATITYAGWVDHTAHETGKAPITSLTWVVPAVGATALGIGAKAFAKATALMQPSLHGATEAPGQ